jgi:hypothetical protein
MPTDGLEEFCIQSLASILRMALKMDRMISIRVDYSELPQAVWTKIAPAIGIFLDQEVIGRMQTEAGYDSKSRARTGFAPRKLPMSDALQARVHQVLDPIYAELEQRRSAAEC